MKIAEITTKDAPVVGFSEGTSAPLSQAVRVGDLLICSGQGPLDAESHEIISQDFREQVRQTLRNLVAVVEAAGSTKEHIVKCNCYLRDISSFAEFNAEYRAFFENNRIFPARTTVQAAPPRNGVLVEVECIAVIPREE